MPKFDKLTRKILTFMCDRPAGTSCAITETWPEFANIPLEDLCSEIGYSKEEVLPAVADLVEHGLAGYRKINSRSTTINVAFHLLHRGLHWKELKGLETRERWKERAFGFISGVLVTVVGGVILKLLLK